MEYLISSMETGSLVERKLDEISHQALFTEDTDKLTRKEGKREGPTDRLSRGSAN
jgi:hypothetical protein